MALPAVQNVTDCANFSQTVLPYVPQLLSLPSKVIQASQEQQFHVLKEFYISTNPLVTAAAFSLALVPIFLLAGELNKNYSQVDRFWSILPSIYNVHYATWAWLNGLAPTAVKSITVISLIWSARLTFNYWRKGGYSIGSEDYRWEIVRSKVKNRFFLLVLNLLFISLMQSLLLFAITTPTYIFLLLSTVPEGELSGLPYLAFSRGMLFFIIIEAFADQQQWNFQRAKRRYLETARVPPEYKNTFSTDDLDRGFVISGLWSLCRHPNFAAEQAVWLTLYLWSCYNTGTYANWTGIGALGYLLLFQGSTRLTESITARKYPEYEDYQARVGMFIPRFSLKPRGQKSSQKKTSKKEE
ncbi:hypothetical protein VTO42DRAFT_1016 [Malbranchea cinnamomea]